MEEQEDYPWTPRSPDAGDIYKDGKQPAVRQQPSLRPTVQTSFSKDDSEDHSLITPDRSPLDIRPHPTEDTIMDDQPPTPTTFEVGTPIKRVYLRDN
jgi:hypothetical protein